MQRYADRSRRSGVVAYEILHDGIVVRFRDGEDYLYTDEATGAEHVAEMKRLARQGRGLATYINKHVRARYAKKLE